MSNHATQTLVNTLATESPQTTRINCENSANCPECGETAVGTTNGGTRYCEACGLIRSGDPIEYSEPGWRTRDQRRTGPAASISRECVGTVIPSSNVNRQTRILAHHNNRLKYSTRSLKDGLREVRNLCAACELSQSTEARGAYLYRCATRAELLKGRSRDSIAAACVYTAARKYNQPVTLADLADSSPVSEQRISGGYRTLLQELNLGLQPPEPQEFLPKVATAAGVPFQVQRRARELLDAATEGGRHIGQSPSGVAAASVYAAAELLEEPLTQAAVAEAAGVSPVTVSRQYQQFQDNQA